jgi:hypothetical protein
MDEIFYCFNLFRETSVFAISHGFKKPMNSEYLFYPQKMSFSSKITMKKTNLLIGKKQERINYTGVRKC